MGVPHRRGRRRRPLRRRPPHPDRLWIRQAYLDRPVARRATPRWRRGPTSAKRGLTNGRFTASLVGSSENRLRYAEQLYTTYLGHDADAGGKAYWADQRATTLLNARARVLSTPRCTPRPAARTGAASSTSTPSPSAPGLLDDVRYWAGHLDSGLKQDPRQAAPRVEQGPVRIVRATYGDLLERNPSAAEVTFWSDVVRRSTSTR